MMLQNQHNVADQSRLGALILDAANLVSVDCQDVVVRRASKISLLWHTLTE